MYKITIYPADVRSKLIMVLIFFLVAIFLTSICVVVKNGYLSDGKYPAMAIFSMIGLTYGLIEAFLYLTSHVFKSSDIYCLREGKLIYLGRSVRALSVDGNTEIVITKNGLFRTIEFYENGSLLGRRPAILISGSDEEIRARFAEAINNSKVHNEY